jgi:AraC-like DNA-binding protein
MEAPNKEAVVQMHDSAHGLIPHEIIEVNSGIVEAFLGRIKYPENFSVSAETGLKIFNDPAFRIILVITTKNAKLLEYDLGTNRAQEMLYKFMRTVKQQIVKHQGRLVEMEGEGFVISFISASLAVKCAAAVQKNVQEISEEIYLRLSLNAGLPVDVSDRLFGTTIKFARHLCDIADKNQLVISSIVDELSKPDYQNIPLSANVRRVTVGDEKSLETLMTILEENWQNPEFTVDDFCKSFSQSTSQLYRRCMSITKMSPNGLIREYRLLKSLYLLRADRNVNQTTYEIGFSSPSYFTRCFRKRFGLLPLQYLKI